MPTATAAKAKRIGKISHFYDQIGVGVIELTGALKVGDVITVHRDDQEFSQTVSSMQIDHKNVEKATKGKSVGIKLSEKVKPGAVVKKG